MEPCEIQRTNVRATDIARIYLRSLRGYWPFVTLAFVGSIGIQVAELTAPLYLRQIFNTIAKNNPDPVIVHNLVGLVLVMMSLWIFSWVARRVQGRSVQYLEIKVMEDLYTSTFAELIRHSHAFFIIRFAGSLTHKVTKFVRGFETLFDSILLQFFPTFLFIGGATGILFLRNHILGLMLGGWAIAFIIFQIYASKLRQPLRVARAAAESKTTGALADAISNQNAIALFSGATFETGLFGGVVHAWQQATQRAWKANETIWSIIGIFTIGIEVALVLGAVLLWGKGLLTVGDFVLIQSYLLVSFEQLVGINR